jgi:hypothetical protein
MREVDRIRALPRDGRYKVLVSLRKGQKVKDLRNALRLAHKLRSVECVSTHPEPLVMGLRTRMNKIKEFAVRGTIFQCSLDGN